MKLPFSIDREQFIAWSEGILLERNTETNKFVAVDELRCQEAEERIFNDEIVYLTNGEEIVSKMVVDHENECIKEIQINSNDVLTIK